MLHKDHAETTIPCITCSLFLQISIAQVHALFSERSNSGVVNVVHKCFQAALFQVSKKTATGKYTCCEQISGKQEVIFFATLPVMQ